MIRATSFTIGEETRKEKVTPRGMPASMKPMKRGTAEQEQKGVTMPRRAASTFPKNSGTFSSTFFVFSGGKKLRSTAMAKMMTTSRKKILAVS